MYLFETLVVRQPSPFSDHCQLITCIKIDPSVLTSDEDSLQEELISLPRQFKWSTDSKESFTYALNSDEIKQLIHDFELSNFEHVGDINTIVKKFANILETAAKQSLKLVKQNKKSKRHSKIWFDQECSRARKNLNHLSHRTHKNPLDEQTRLEYLSTRSQYKQLLRIKKLQHRDNQIDELVKTRHPLNFWTNLKSLSNQVKSSPDSTVPMRKLYNHFQQLHSEPNVNLLEKQEVIMKELIHKKTILSQLNSLDKPFSEEEVKQSIKMLKNKKAAGLDRIRNEMLKCGARYLTTSLTKLFNFILTKGTYPDSWSTGLISPIFKSGNKSDPSNYRGICVTSCLGKLFSAVLNNRLLNYLQDHDLIHPSQIGFLKGSRTSDHIFSLRTLIDKYVTHTNKGKLFCCFIDFQKAFDSIWHDGLLHKLLYKNIGGQFYHLISDMYLKTKCAVKNGNKRSSFFDYNRGVRQGCILSPILFNLYLDEFPRLLETSRDTDSITLPNGLPLNCLFYADDLILISRSAAGLQKQLNILHSYSEKWLLKINLKKTKTLIFQKQNRKSTRDKFSFFLNGIPIDKASQYNYLGITFNTNGSFANSKKGLVEKARRSIFATKRYLDFNKLPINTCNKLFDTLFLPILLYGSEIWGAYDNMNFKKWENDPVERQHTQFYKHFLGLNRRAANVVARNETGRLPLKLNILLRIIKFWIHLESLPENSIAKQCLIMSNKLANETKSSFMLTVNEIIHNYIDVQKQSHNKTIQNNIMPTIKNNLQKIKSQISNHLKRHQLELIHSNRKLCFYSTFKTDISKSDYLEQIKNLKHRRAVAKLRSGNHSLRIESGRHCVPKLPESLRICQHCRSNQIENENHFLFHCDRYNTIRQQITNDIVLKYPSFDLLNDTDKTIFLFNNVDSFICKKLGYFVYEALHIRETCNPI